MLSVYLVVTPCLVSQHFFTLPGRHGFHAGKPRPSSCSPWEVSGAGLSPDTSYMPLCVSAPQGSTFWASRGSLAHSHFLGSGSWGHRLSKKGPGAPGGAVAPPAMCQPWGLGRAQLCLGQRGAQSPKKMAPQPLGRLPGGGEATGGGGNKALQLGYHGCSNSHCCWTCWYAQGE